MAKYSKYRVVPKEKLDAISKAIQEKAGVSGGLTLDGMQETANGIYPNSLLESLIDRSITEIEIPLSVTTIGRNAFTYCNYLENVKFHEGITFIGASAFGNCGALKEFEFPKGISSLEFGVLQSCSGLKKVTIPDTVTTIKQQSIGYCAWLTTLSLPNSITEISQTAFTGDTRLEFIYCDWAEGKVANAPWGAPSTVQIHYDAFWGFWGLDEEGTHYQLGSVGIGLENEEHLVIPSEYKGSPVTAIYESPFTFKDIEFKAKSIVVPSSITDLGANAFQGLEYLTDIYVPWAEGEMWNAPWGAPSTVQIHYNHTT
jgi:hypothetical protein